MTSSQPIATPNAINFTPDNKRAYAYSSAQILTGGAFLKQLDFETNSEYIVASFTWANGETNATRDVYITIDFNEVSVYLSRWENPNITDKGASPLVLVIPPFTHVECYQKNDGTTTGCFTMTGKVYGMTETGFQ